MGNREKLLAGAVRCLREKGYARTTARDIAAAAGTSLAAIGYHFGSTEALLNAALFQAIAEVGEETDRAMASADVRSGDGPAERFERRWAAMLESFEADRPLWAATFEIYPQIERVPELRQAIAEAYQRLRAELAAEFHRIDAAADEKKAQVVGSFYQALMIGVLGMLLVDPEHGPSASDLAEALRVISADIQGSGKSSDPG